MCDSDVEPITLDEDSDFHTTTTNSQQQQQQQQHAAIDSTKQAGVKRRYEQEGEKQGVRDTMRQSMIVYRCAQSTLMLILSLSHFLLFVFFLVF